MKRLPLIFAACGAAILYSGYDLISSSSLITQDSNYLDSEDALYEIGSPYQTSGLQAGAFLAADFAQKHQDWDSANKFVEILIDANIDPNEMLQRAMVLSIGAGHPEKAIKIAHRLTDEYSEIRNSIADILLISEAVKNDDYNTAEVLFESLPNVTTIEFIGPFLKGWINAGKGLSTVKEMNANTAQLYHGILISDFLNDHTDMEKMIDQALRVENVTPSELDRIADLYGHVGLKDRAIALYQKALKSVPDDEAIKEKIKNLTEGSNKPLFPKVTSARAGLAKSFHDIAMILHKENNDESARVFAHMGAYLEPESTEIKTLLAQISEDHEQYEKAIAYYQSIPETDNFYLQAQHSIVDIYEETKRYDEALEVLNKLVKNKPDADSYIKIGDLHRIQNNFGLALKAYDNASEALNDNITKEYWHLHYVKGIAYEQTNDWERAEKELKAALELQPDHPYVLNYLGYAWADQGVNLDEALNMIQRAVSLLPTDGYITDSLGWVMYRTQNYKRAVPVLERAAQLLPNDPTVNDHLGDAYWQTNRKLEARFQWERAKNNATDPSIIQELNKKLSSGLTDDIQQTK